MNSQRCIWILAMAGSINTAAFAADREIKVDDRLDASAETLTDMMKADDKGVPQDLLDKARCVVVVPGMKKAGFIFGAKYGRGFAVCRRAGGLGWSAPAAMRVEGGSVGFQIGASETDIVLLVMNEGGMKRLLSDKFTIGGDATAAAGPVGRDVSRRRMNSGSATAYGAVSPMSKRAVRFRNHITTTAAASRLVTIRSMRSTASLKRLPRSNNASCW